MRMFNSFLKKEFLEIIRTYRFFILLIVFVLFGIMNPVMAKMMPDMLKSFMPEGMSITIAEPTALDSWAQFFKNVSQMGLIILVIVFSGIISNEFNKGTLINILAKGLSRHIVILSKFAVAFIIWTICYLTCFLITYFYTQYFWSISNVFNLEVSILGLWVFGVFLISTLIIGGLLFENNFGSLLFTFLMIFVLVLLNIIPNLKDYNPISLVTQNMDLLSKKINISVFCQSMIVSGFLITLFIIFSIMIFNKKQI